MLLHCYHQPGLKFLYSVHYPYHNHYVTNKCFIIISSFFSQKHFSVQVHDFIVNITVDTHHHRMMGESILLAVVLVDTG